MAIDGDTFESDVPQAHSAGTVSDPLSMVPNAAKVTLADDREQRVKALLQDLVVGPRLELIKWSRITKQSPNVKIGYPGQHLSSLITGVEGARSGARGHDLVDGSEVKSCSRVDQLDKCKDCGAGVARIETECPECNSTNIKRNNDSKWLFGVRTEEELTTLLDRVGRVVLMLSDHPGFAEGEYSTLRFQAFEIWPRNPRHGHFRTLMDNYYRKIYLAHREKNPTKTPAPKNFWPYSYQFFMCNPVRTFQATVTDADTEPKISVDLLVDPLVDRASLPSEGMPAAVAAQELPDLLGQLSQEEVEALLLPDKTLTSLRGLRSAKAQAKLLKPIPEELRSRLRLRDTDVPVSQQDTYHRREL